VRVVVLMRVFDFVLVIRLIISFFIVFDLSYQKFILIFFIYFIIIGGIDIVRDTLLFL
jgi:hypothetical protein